MTFPAGKDRFDEVRRAWIAKHQGWSLIQHRRAEQLGRRIRARQRANASAVPDPHDDTGLPPIWLRTAKSPAAQIEFAVVTIAGLMVPFGWLAGWCTSVVLARSIPEKLRGYPIAALMCSGTALGLLTLLLSCATYDPASPLRQVVLLPWVCLQLAVVPAVAGVYGVADGWLAVPASRKWWPVRPTQRPLSAQDATEILAGYDLTGPMLIDAQRLNEQGERTRA